jgi:RNA polymerase sigma factor (sigma-70 family)
MMATTLAGVLNNLRRSFRRQASGLADGQLLASFVTRRDETAFATIMDRHGPMVLGVCRRVLQNEADAEDAFQSTFLVLARKAASIQPLSMVGNWLHGVAHTTALKARAMRAKRLAKEREAAAQARPNVAMETWRQLETLLDQELRALPEKYRSAIVLCDLEGKSIKEAGGQLGCPTATIGTRLSRGRSLLARRLARQGLAFTPIALVMALSQNAVKANMASCLAIKTCEAAVLFATVGSDGLVSARVASLTQAILRMMLLTRLKIGMGVLAIVLLIGTVVGFQVTARTLGNGVSPAEKFPRQAPIVDGEQTRFSATSKELTDVNQTTAEAPEERKEMTTLKLPPGLARQPANHPGRVAWMKAHGNSDGK